MYNVYDDVLTENAEIINLIHYNSLGDEHPSETPLCDVKIHLVNKLTRAVTSNAEQNLRKITYLLLPIKFYSKFEKKICIYCNRICAQTSMILL